jgi:tRNA dimethylallyltransferase
LAAASERPQLCPVIAGPTAVGKTDLVLALARKFPVEVVSLDSRQIYHGLRIGTAQPSAAERAACPHHLVDFLPPEETYTAQRYRDDFVRLWGEITARGRLPLLVGGAGFYLHALTHGLLPLPDDADDRLPRIRDEIAALPVADLDAELARVDPRSATTLHPNDRYRRQRALEIWRLTGRPLSDHMAGHRPEPALGLEFPLVRLEREVDDLDARIAARTAAMLGAGWLGETAALLESHPADCPGLRSIGYAEIVQHLGGHLRREDLAPRIVQVTRQYAKRQRTWFRPLEAATSGSPDAPDLRAAVGELVERAGARLGA